MTENQGNNQLADQAGAQAGNQTTQGTTSITGSQITSAGDTTYQPTGNAAAQGAMGITGSITDMTPDKDAGGPHPLGGVNPRT
ncbi:MAG TPA: hypothetical protein VNT75_08225 [Symbiobacteriaceae bacterium]|nr:hypothetical protein [Symbiobacteriaceae bacterium]